MLRYIFGCLISLLICLQVVPAWAASSVVQTATMAQFDASSATSFAISFASTPTPGNTVVMVGCIYDADLDYTITGVTDNQSGNTYTTRSSISTRTSDRVYSFIGHASGVAASGTYTTTVTLAGTSGGADRYITLGLLEIAGIVTSSAEDQWDANNDINVATTTDASAGPTGTTTQANEMAVGAAAYSGGNAALAWASPAGYTNQYRENNGSAHQGCDVATNNLSATGTQTLQWTHTNSASAEAGGVVVTLKDVAACRGALMLMGIGGC